MVTVFVVPRTASETWDRNVSGSVQDEPDEVGQQKEDDGCLVFSV